MTRFTFKYLKPIALLLSVLVLFQCCTVFDKRPVSIKKAINKDPEQVKWILIKTHDGQKLIVNSIYYKGDDLYYSKEVKSREKIENSDLYRTKIFMAEAKIDENNIAIIKLHNKGKSITRSVLLGLGIPILIIVGYTSYIISTEGLITFD